MSNLLFQSSGGLPALRFHQSCPQLVVETRQILCHFAALLVIESGLKVPDHKNGMIDLACAAFNVPRSMRS